MPILDESDVELSRPSDYSDSESENINTSGFIGVHDDIE